MVHKHFSEGQSDLEQNRTCTRANTVTKRKTNSHQSEDYTISAFFESNTRNKMDPHHMKEHERLICKIVLFHAYHFILGHFGLLKYLHAQPTSL